VCVQQGSQLVICQSYAQKFVDNEITKTDALTTIENHNEKYNDGGEYWQTEERPWLTKNYQKLLCLTIWG
jgi:hypothetical protein